MNFEKKIMLKIYINIIDIKMYFKNNIIKWVYNNFISMMIRMLFKILKFHYKINFTH